MGVLYTRTNMVITEAGPGGSGQQNPLSRCKVAHRLQVRGYQEILTPAIVTNCVMWGEVESCRQLHFRI